MISLNKRAAVFSKLFAGWLVALKDGLNFVDLEASRYARLILFSSAALTGCSL